MDFGMVLYPWWGDESLDTCPQSRNRPGGRGVHQDFEIPLFFMECFPRDYLQDVCLTYPQYILKVKRSFTFLTYNERGWCFYYRYTSLGKRLIGLIRCYIYMKSCSITCTLFVCYNRQVNFYLILPFEIKLKVKGRECTRSLRLLNDLGVRGGDGERDVGLDNVLRWFYT